MARIIKKAITPVLLAYTRTARRNYSSSSSSIFINPQLKKNSSTNISRSSSSLIYQIRTPTRDFSSSSSIGKKGPSGSDKKVVETPREFPFNIEDIPGEQTITLTRKHRGDDIRVIVHMPADHSSTIEGSGDELDNQNHDKHKDSFGDLQSSIRLVVSGTNFLGTTLEYGVIAYPDDFSIDSFCIKYTNAPDEENIYYRGPEYAKLDKNLQKEFRRRLKIIGIVPSTTNFLHEYMANRDMCSSDSSNPSPPATNQPPPEPIETTLFNDEGIPVDSDIEMYRQRGHPLVSAEDIRNSGKNHKDFIWIPYLYTRSEKPLWIEVPREGFYDSESELQREVELQLINARKEDSLFLDGEADNPYRCLPPKEVGDPPVFSEEMDKILYPDLKHMENATDHTKAWEELGVALKAHNDEMNKIKYPNGPPDVVELCDSDLEHYQVWHL
ncbi:hypothetical protein MKW98_012836 [Papaver atlanticum]|uniref:Uncharacterized protein n=1 Tax=Papaver atlanticum TaxID=357466 RepID=A0AAD4SL96_9MAGN|nr:hypothetical protein MKW98_012836 [Papaver atlanticum]